MKKLFLAVTLSATFLACQDPGNQSDRLPETFTVGVGAIVDADLGMRWINNIERVNKGPQNGETFSVSQSTLEKVMEQEGVMGISFYYGLDNSGTQHIVMTAVNEDHLPWKGPVIDTNTDQKISYETAQTWINNYKAANEGAVVRHSYGINIFRDIKTHKAFNIVQALDDEQHKALLLVVHGDGTNNTIYWDNGMPCPPYCP